MVCATIVGLVASAQAQAPAPVAPAQTLERLVVTGTRTGRLIADAPVRTEVITERTIAATGARALGEAVEYTAGLRVESDCQNCNASGIRILGLEQAYNIILFDSLPLLSSLASVYGIDQIPARLIEQIEVLKGGASSLYGAGAVGGVVNIIPRLPTRKETAFDYTFESRLGAPAHASTLVLSRVSPERKLAATVFVALDRAAALDVDGDGYTELTRNALEVAGTRIVAYPSKGARLTFDFTHAHEVRRGGNLLDVPEHRANIAESLKTSRDFGGAQWRQTFTPDFNFNLAAWATFTRRQSYYGGLGDPATSGYDPVQAAAAALTFYGKTKNPLYYFDMQLNLTRGRHTLTFGPQYRWEHIDDRYANPAFVPIDASFHTASAYVQDDWRATDTLNIVAGARVDKNSVLSKARLSPRLAVKWAASPVLDFRASLATGYRAPEVLPEDLHSESAGGTPVQSRNTPGLRPEEALSSTLGADWRPNSQWRVEAVLFRTALEDTFVSTRSPDPRFVGSFTDLRENGGGSTVQGAEFNLGFQPAPRWQALAGVVLQRSPYAETQNYDEDGNGEAFGLYRERLKTPRTYGVAQLTYRAPHGLSTFLGAKFTGPLLAGRRDLFAADPALTRIRRTPSFLVLDASVGYDFHLPNRGEITVTVGAKNLSNSYQEDIERGPSRDNDYVYGPRIPRSIFVSVQTEF